MSCRNKLSGVLLIITSNLLIYFARSFPVLTHYPANPRLGPFFEGDITSNPWDRNGLPSESYRWTKGILKFHVQDDYSFNEMWLIYSALLEITSKTCIEVEELLTSGYFKDHVYYSPNRQYCSSGVGRRGWRQIINLPPLCLVGGAGAAIHETIHALGFYHEQNREDRDDYVTINYNNIIPSAKKNFYIYPSNSYGVPYDYGSIMHYGAYDFAIDENVKTIEVKQPGAVIGQQERMTIQDMRKINLMYNAECNSRLRG